MSGNFTRGLLSRINIKSIKLLPVLGVLALGLLLSSSFLGLGLLVGAKYGDLIPVVKDIEQNRQVSRELAGRESTGPLDAMAIRIAELTAQIIRLEAITQRIITNNPLPEGEDTLSEPVGQGGLKDRSGEPVSFSELQKLVRQLSVDVNRQGDILSVLDADLQAARVAFASKPTETPVFNATTVSRFGSRIDPFTGRHSRHEGIDFVAARGTPILAAASGVVIRSGYHSGYGYMIDIQHADDVVTRYAHASKLLVKEGDRVRIGQEIAKVGSTGRSTGPHLHFEVRVAGVPKDPRKFIEQNGLPRPGPATVAAVNGLLDANH